jgi:hypothetical protein
VTLYKDQLDQAFTGPDQFGSFISLVMQNASDQLEQARETIKRNTLVNLIGAILGNYATDQNIKLVTEYNAYLGLTGQTLQLSRHNYRSLGFLRLFGLLNRIFCT